MSFDARYPQFGKSNSQQMIIRLGKQEARLPSSRLSCIYVFEYHVTSGFIIVRPRLRVSELPTRALSELPVYGFTLHATLFFFVQVN
jgi:hypothetical protein